MRSSVDIRIISLITADGSEADADGTYMVITVKIYKGFRMNNEGAVGK